MAAAVLIVVYCRLHVPFRAFSTTSMPHGEVQSVKTRRLTGVTNALLQFMNMMNDVLSDYLDDFVLVFLDDILVYSRIVEIHAEQLGKILEALRRHRLFTKA